MSIKINEKLQEYSWRRFKELYKVAANLYSDGPYAIDQATLAVLDEVKAGLNRMSANPTLWPLE